MFGRWIDSERLTHSIKTALACIIGFLLTGLIGFSASQWIVITIIVVMCAQRYVGSVVQKAYLRFLGTLIGCLFAVIAIELTSQSTIVTAGVIGLSSLIFSYLATGQESLSYAGTLGAATTAIIMLGQQEPTILTAGARFLEISIGILIAALISQFVLPIHARSHLRRTQAETIAQLRDFYNASMVTHSSDSEPARYAEIDENIVKLLSKQRQLAKEASREPLGSVYDPAHFMRTLQCEKELLRCIGLMHNAYSKITKMNSPFTQSPLLQSFNTTILQSLDTLINAIQKSDASLTHLHLPPLSRLKTEALKNLEVPSREELLYIDGFLFSASTLIQCLEELAGLFRLLVYTDENAND